MKSYGNFCAHVCYSNCRIFSQTLKANWCHRQICVFIQKLHSFSTKSRLSARELSDLSRNSKQKKLIRPFKRPDNNG